MKKSIFSTFAALMLLGQSAAAETHIVCKGDTYWTISRQYGVSLSALLEANNASDGDVLNIGDAVTVPQIHTVVKGDTYWTISLQYGVSLSDLLEANNASDGDVLNIGDTVIVPSCSSCSSYVVKKGDTYWTISQQYGVSLSALLEANNASDGDVLDIGDVLTIPDGESSDSSEATETEDTAYVTYGSYTVKSGDTLWSIAIDCGIPMEELLEANGLTEDSVIYDGSELTFPIHHIPVKDAPEGYGELLDWETEAQYVVPIGAIFTVTDLSTGKSFAAKRTVGSSHADCEPLTAEDTATMKEIWGGSFNWNKRAVIVTCNGRKIAASAASMPHAGNEWADGGVWTEWRSGNYGAGINYDYVKGNDFSGHFDIHFLNSTRHSDGAVDSAHQANVLKAAGQ